MKKALFRLQYELDSNQPYTEQGTDRGAKLSEDHVENVEVKEILDITSQLSPKEWLKWLSVNKDLRPIMAVIPLSTLTPEALNYRLNDKHPKIVFFTRPMHTLQKLNECLYMDNEMLDYGSYLCCHSMTALLKRKMIEATYPWGVRQVVAGSQYLWHRVCPKLRFTRKLYFALTDGKNRTFSRVEILGRLYRAGFEVVDEQFRQGEFFVTARKIKSPVQDTEPTGSPIIHLQRKGKNGKDIVVHKFRTMFTYSEYIQSYIYQYQHLEIGGKFKDDYRVTAWGRFLRKVWLDELPMVWNLLRGDIKLVGVRPLSKQYFNLYSTEMQELRSRTKPGLLPPFYYERTSPKTLEEVQESERRYLVAYLEHSFKTDWRYFWGIVGNILFRRKHSA
jgi:lipopolysaccharide/colanic/teichoic acid biosynthesis glycosyltransferase